MRDSLVLMLGMATLLATPGPTNTLLLAAGARRGMMPSLNLVAAELAGYLIAIAGWTMIGRPWIAEFPSVLLAFKLCAAAYLLWCAVRFWRPSAARFSEHDGFTAARVLRVTLLNPKALIFAFVLLADRALLPGLALFVLVAVPIALGWLFAGERLGRAAGDRLSGAAVGRIAAVGYAGFAGMLAFSAAHPSI